VSEHKGLRGRATLDFLKLLAAIVRKYGDNGEIRITNEDLRSRGGGIKREIDGETGDMIYRYIPRDGRRDGDSVDNVR
jgi:hypothetical protein